MISVFSQLFFTVSNEMPSVQCLTNCIIFTGDDDMHVLECL